MKLESFKAKAKPSNNHRRQDVGEAWNEKEEGVVYAKPEDWLFQKLANQATGSSSIEPLKMPSRYHAHGKAA